MNYVAGFMFSHDRSRVALIRKSKPAWQAGKLNGIGGKVEDADKDIWRAMVREFNEETGYLTTVPQWEHFCMMEGNNNGRWKPLHRGFLCGGRRPEYVAEHGE